MAKGQFRKGFLQNGKRIKTIKIDASTKIIIVFEQDIKAPKKPIIPRNNR